LNFSGCFVLAGNLKKIVLTDKFDGLDRCGSSLLLRSPFIRRKLNELPCRIARIHRSTFMSTSPSIAARVASN